MTVSIDEIRQGWIDAALKLWNEPIRDIQRGQPHDADRIERICEAIGWGDWFLDQRGGDGYDEGPGERWCGIGQAYIGRELLPDHCGYRLRKDLARDVLPSTDRLYDASRWPDEAPQPDGSIDDLAPGVIATVGDGPDGSHVVLVESVNREAGTYTTIECNGTGVLGDGHYGEGVIRRFSPGAPIEDYQGRNHTVSERSIDGIKCVYPLDERHVVEA